MKRIVSAIILTAVLLSSFLIVLPVSAATVTDAAGLGAALEAATGETVITLSGTVTPTSLSWPVAEANVTLTGGTLDLSGIATLHIGCHLTLENVSLILRNGGTIYANGYDFTVKESVTVTYKEADGTAVTGASIAMTVYGGSYSGVINGDTHLCLESGIYTRVYGGSNGGRINGSTHVVIGTAGDVNNNTLVGWNDDDHGSTYQFFGGSNGGTITGDTTITVGSYGYADYVVGGNAGGGEIHGTANMYFSGYAYGLYGGSRNGELYHDVNLVMTGGGVCDIFGGSSGYSLGSDTDQSQVFVKIFGGEIRRRVYVGSYNEEKADGAFVNGSCTLILGGSPNVSLADGNSDRGVFAHSRYAPSSKEEKRIIFVGGKDFSSILGRDSGDFMGSIAIGSGANPSTKHKMSYAASGSTITETCSCGCGHSDRISMDLSATEFFYTGSPIECATLTYGSGWLSGPVAYFGYQNNITPGTATVSMQLRLDVAYTASAQFTIIRRTGSVSGDDTNDFDYNYSESVPVQYTTDETYQISIPETIRLGGLNVDVPVSDVGIRQAVLSYHHEVALYVSSQNQYRVMDGDLFVPYTMTYGDIAVSAGTEAVKLVTLGWNDADNADLITLQFKRTADATGGAVYSDLLTFTSSVKMMAGMPLVNGKAFDTDAYDVGEGSRLSVAENVGGSAVFRDYVRSLQEAGYGLYTTNAIGANHYATLVGENGEGESIIINTMYIDHYDEIRVVTDLADTFDLPGLQVENTYTKWAQYTPSLTLVSGADIGWPGRMGYVYQLEDGSFFVIDGGFTQGTNLSADAYYDDVIFPEGVTVPKTSKNYHSALPFLIEVLETFAPDKDHIVIAAWFITHTHEDHFGAFYDLATLKEYKAFKEKLTIEQLIYNQSSDAEIARLDGYKNNTDNSDWVALFAYAADRLEAEGRILSRVKAHPGQQFFLRTLTMTVYTSQDLLHGSEHYAEGDSYDPFLTGSADGANSKYVNNTSIVTAIDFMGKRALYMADSSAGNNPYVVAPIYGSVLDEVQILQTAHHGYSDTDAGSVYEQMTGLEVVFWATGAQHFYGREIGYKENGKWYTGTKTVSFNQVLFRDGVKHFNHGNCSLTFTDLENYVPDMVGDELQVYDKDTWVADLNYITNNGYK